MHIPSACWQDPRIAVRPSPIDGLGLFATAPIAQGEIVEVLGGTLLTDAQVQAMIDDYAKRPGQEYQKLRENRQLALSSEIPRRLRGGDPLSADP